MKQRRWRLDWRRVVGTLVMVLVIGLFFVGMFLPDNPPTTKKQKEESTETPSLPSVEDPVEEEDMEESQEPPQPIDKSLTGKFLYPKIQSVKGRTGNEAPPGAVEAAGKFHYLIIFSSPYVTTNQVLNEMENYTTKEIIQKLRDGGYELNPQPQKWNTIKVSPFRKINDRHWILNCVAVVDGESTWTYMDVVKEGERWKVTEVSREPL